MSFLRNVWTDLVEKKLWPVAILLVLALVAVPLVISSGGSDETAAAPLPGEGTAGAAGVTAAQVALTPGTPVRLDRAGRERNPFEQQHLPKAPSTGATGAASAAGQALEAAASAVKAAQAASGAGQPATPTTTAQTTTPAPAATPPRPSSKADTIQEAFSVVLTVNQVGNDPVRRDVGRLTPLPSAATPSFVYLGVLKDRRTAVFLLSSEVTADGEGTCRPKGTDCQTVELKAGERETFDVMADDGTVARQYEVRLVRVEKDGVPTTATAASTKARAKAASAKQRVTAKAAAQAALASDGNDQYLVDHDTGLLQRTSSRFRAKQLTKAQARTRAVKALELGVGE